VLEGGVCDGLLKAHRHVQCVDAAQVREGRVCYGHLVAPRHVELEYAAQVDKVSVAQVVATADISHG